MRLRNIILGLMACLALASSAQPVMNQEDWQWYLGKVVNDVFVGRNYFEYYYTPSDADMEQQRSKGEVTYFLNSPEGLNAKKVRDMIDRLMASYDDIKAASDWQMTSTTYWKEFRFEKNKFRFSVKRKALDDGTYYVSATETASYYKSLGNNKSRNTKEVKENRNTKKAKDTKASVDKPSTRSSRRTITQEDVEEVEQDNPTTTITLQEEDIVPVVNEKERRRAAREREQALEQEQRLAKRRAQEQQREEAQKQKEEEKQKKAEEKKKKEEEKRLAQEEKRHQREQARLEREEARKKAAERKPIATAATKTAESKYHYNDIALWLSEKYDFTQTAASENSCTMFSTAVKDLEMAKLAIKNALKGSNARMAVPWRINNETQEIETGFSVDDQVLVFSIGKDAEERVTITVTEIDNDQFESFKQSLNGH